MDFFATFNGWCSGFGFGHGGGGMHNWLPFHMGSIFQLLIVGLIIYFTVRILRKPATINEPGNAEEILRRRYALGEIDEQTYKAMKKDLN